MHRIDPVQYIARRCRPDAAGARLAAGKADPFHFTSAACGTLLPELRQVAAFYQWLGRLTSFRLIQRTRAGDQATLRYRTVFGKTSWIHTFVLTDGDKIADVAVEPE